MKTKYLVFSLALLLLCALFSLSVMAEGESGFNAGLTVDRTNEANGFFTVTVQQSDVLEEKQPLLALPCTYAAAQITAPDGSTQTGEIADGSVTFRVSMGGTYTVTAVTAKEVNLYNANMILGNSLAINYYVKQADLTEGKTYYARVTMCYSDDRGTVETEIPFADWVPAELEGVPVYKFTFDGIAAKEMTDEMQVQIFTADDDRAAGKQLTYSIRRYAMTMLGYYTSGEWATAFVDMLNYGAAAQRMFDYAEDDYANSQLTDGQKALATQTVSPQNSRVVGEKYYNVSLSLEDNIVLYMFFAKVTDDMYAVVTFTDHTGEVKSVTVPFDRFIQYSGDIYRVPVDNLVIADGRQSVKCVLYNGSGEQVGMGQDSVEGYIEAMMKAYPDDPSYADIFKFVVSAYNALH